MSKNWIKRSLVASGAMGIASKFLAPGVAIIMYHSVMNDPTSAESTLGGIIHSTAVFRGQMEVLARHFNVVSLSDVFLFVKGEKTIPPRAVVVTFDDGYADNYRAANEILGPLGVPGVFYVTVDCVDKQKLPWPSLLRHAFMSSERGKWAEPEGKVWALSSREQRLLAFDRASEYCSKLAGDAQDRFVELLQSDLQTETPRTAQRPMMTWDEVRGLDRHGHTVGSHTMTHPNVAFLTESELQTELAGAKRRLEEELGKPVRDFSYPCPALQPHWTERTVSASRQIGYQTAVTTNGGLVRKSDNPLSLRRIRPTKTVEGLRWNLECTFLGRAA